ncbi:MAG: amidohydrolase family protein, partial [bacterium]
MAFRQSRGALSAEVLVEEGMIPEVETIKQNLLKEIEQIPVIDCHEHLPTEEEHLSMTLDLFSLFLSYTLLDLRQAGMSEEDTQSLFNKNLPLESRWELFEPYWNQVRYGSYAQAVLITVKKFWGIEDINRNTYQTLSEAIANSNTPGIYDRVLKDACNIKTCLTQCGKTDTGTALLTPVIWIPDCDTEGTIRFLDFEPSTRLESLDDYVDAVCNYIRRVKSEGAVGLKCFGQEFTAPDKKAASEIFKHFHDNEDFSPLKKEQRAFIPPSPLFNYIADIAFGLATELELVFAIHTGYWGDFRNWNPTNVIPTLERHPNTRFDLYHLGYPFVGESINIGDRFPNVWLNFCWTHIISKKCAYETMDQVIDTVPVNKILGFGGDYGVPSQTVYGHLVMARDNIAGVLANRIANKKLTETQA